MKAVLLAIALGASSVASASAQITWPHQISSSAGPVTIYQPQIDAFTGNQVTAHAAVSVAVADGKPTFGAIFFTANVSTDRGTDLVNVQSVLVTSSHFPRAATGTADAVSQAVTQDAAQGHLTLSQNELLAQLALTQKEQAAAADLDNTPPRIVFATTPTALVTISGEPRLAAAPDSSILTVVNSPFFIALDPAAKTYYLRGGGRWLSTADILAGPWAPAASVPDAVTSLAAAQQAAQQDPAPAPGTPAPRVLVATQPTELIQTTGPAEFGPIDNTNLLYVTNTDRDVLMDIDSQSLYVLLAGRWFTAASPAGPWTYVAPAQLPASFAQIPAGLPISNALASVPGTTTATNAVLDAQVPQTAAIRRDATGPKVTYDGDPKFEPVAKASPVSYAVNSPHSVLEVGTTYFVCSEGVWFQATDALGPWIVSAEVPPVIYTIPPTCPIYPVTYCRIYSTTPEVVYCGYLPGYTGSYVVGGTVVYGTGWPYAPWYGGIFIPRPVTWGFGATFSPGWGCWGFGVGAGWGAASFGCSWRSGWWGAGNYHWNNWNWNNNWNRNITRNVTNNVTNNFYHTTNNIYRNNANRLTPQERQRLDANKTHGRNQADERNRANAAANAQRPEDRQQANRDEARRRTDERPRNDAANAGRTAPRNDVYADHDGNVYRHDGAGWQQRQGDDWHAPNRENFDRNRAELNHQFAARSRGGQAFRGGGRR